MPSSLDLLGLRLNLGHRETSGLHENPCTKKQSNVSLLLGGGGRPRPWTATSFLVQVWENQLFRGPTPDTAIQEQQQKLI